MGKKGIFDNFRLSSAVLRANNDIQSTFAYVCEIQLDFDEFGSISNDSNRARVKLNKILSIWLLRGCFFIMPEMVVLVFRNFSAIPSIIELTSLNFVPFYRFSACRMSLFRYLNSFWYHFQPFHPPPPRMLSPNFNTLAQNTVYTLCGHNHSISQDFPPKNKRPQRTYDEFAGRRNANAGQP